MKSQYYKIKENILLIRTGDEEDTFSLILPEIKNDLVSLGDKNGFTVDETEEGINFCDAKNKKLFVQKKVEFIPIEITKHVVDGKPDVEVINTVDGSRTQIKNLIEVKNRDSYKVILYLKLDEKERIYGLGQDEEGIYNKRGKKHYLYQHNMITPMPFFISEKGYGILFDASCLIEFDDTGYTTKITFDSLDMLDYYIITGNADEIIGGYRYLTGKAAMLPKWTFGYLQSKERYETGKELVDVVREHRNREIPIDCVIQDWKTWEGDLWGNKVVDKTRFPNLAAMNDEIHKMNVHTMVSIWPNMNAGGENHDEFSNARQLLNDYSTYNAFDEQARKMYWRQSKKELFDGGFDAWWCDSTEPFTAPDWCGYPKRSEEERYKLVGDEHKRYLDPTATNAYSLVHAKGIYENQRKETEDKRVFNLTRSGYPGIQRYGVSLWAGDTSASWDELRKEISKGISVGLSGLPYWTVDIGAFFAGGTACWRKWKGDENASPVWFWNGEYDNGVNDERYKELYVRWLQYGAFLPIFRSHGTDTPREIWNFGEPGTPYYDAIKETIELRYMLMVYIYSMAARVTYDDYTIMRSLIFDFPDDETAKDISDEFMFGDSMLICPVILPSSDAKERICYLPKGKKWYDFWSNECYEGGQYISVEVSLDRIPIFVPAGSIIPLGHVIQHTGEEQNEIHLKIYSGDDCKFEFYYDDGDGYSYENGDFAKNIVILNDKERYIEFGEMIGKLKDKVAAKKYQIVVIDVHNKDETERALQYECEIEYIGSEIVLKI